MNGTDSSVRSVVHSLADFPHIDLHLIMVQLRQALRQRLRYYTYSCISTDSILIRNSVLYSPLKTAQGLCCADRQLRGLRRAFLLFMASNQSADTHLSSRPRLSKSILFYLPYPLT
jgi:hypothetical protein